MTSPTRASSRPPSARRHGCRFVRGMTTNLTPGSEFGPSSWIEVPQAKIDAFAEATGDHQWIHVDPEKAAQGPFGTTIGHGYLTLSLLPVMSYEVLPRQDGGMS